MNTTLKCRVQPGKQLAHGGQVLDGGADVELPAALAFEVRHLVHQVTETGEVKPLGAEDQSEAELAAALATARPHERISILESARDRAAGDLKKIDDAIAAEQKRLVPDAPKPERAAVKPSKDT